MMLITNLGKKYALTIFLPFAGCKRFNGYCGKCEPNNTG